MTGLSHGRARSRRGDGIDRAAGLPVLWLFTDATRLADPRDAVARLPRGLCGVVLRHDAAADRRELGRDLAAICRARRLALVVAGDRRLAAALRAGEHLRGGRIAGPAGAGLPQRLTTSSAHNIAELRRARRAGCQAAFLSPAFATASHAGARPLGAVRWSNLARLSGLPVFALGGVSGQNVRRLSIGCCQGAGAIGALA